MRTIIIIYTTIVFLVIPESVNGQKVSNMEQFAVVKKAVIQHDGKMRNARIISVKSTFNFDITDFFHEEMIIANTLRITKPLAHIKMKTGGDHVQFQEGFTYEMRIYTLGLIPFGGLHYIHIETIDMENKFIQTREKNNIAKVWDHMLKFNVIDEETITYEDEVTLCAGWLTPILAKYLVVFYKMRHRNWNKLLKDKYEQLN